MNIPKITIVTPSFNQSGYLEETILSVLGQNYPNLEYIIIDGGSTDESLEIIKKYESRLAYWVSEKDNGMYYAIQKGFDRCTGDLMAWINSDDKYYPGAFSIVSEVFSKFSDVDWIQGIPTVMDENSRIVCIADAARKWSRYNYLLYDYRWLQQESCFWRKSLWDKAGKKVNTSLKYAGDFELWLRFFEYAKLHSLTAPLGTFRFRSSQQFSLERLGDYIKEAENCLAKKISELPVEEKKVLSRIKKYASLSHYPVLRNYYYPQYLKLFDYPKTIEYDRLSQSFLMK